MTKKVKHGGKRLNAGAKAKLDYQGRLAVGSWCEVEWKRQHIAARDKREAQDPRLEVYLSYVRDASDILKAKTSKERQHRINEHSKLIAGEYSEAKPALAERQPRLKGPRGTIIQEALVRFRPSYPRLTPSAVNAAWVWFRDFEEQLREDLKDSTRNPDNAHFSDES